MAHRSIVRERARTHCSPRNFQGGAMRQRQQVGGGQGVERVSVSNPKPFFEKCRCQREAGEGMMDIMAAIITSTERRACGGRPPSKSRSRARIKSSSGTERGGAEAPFPSLFLSCGLLPNDTTTMHARFPFLLPTYIHRGCSPRSAGGIIIPFPRPSPPCAIK